MGISEQWAIQNEHTETFSFYRSNNVSVMDNSRYRHYFDSRVLIIFSYFKMFVVIILYNTILYFTINSLYYIIVM